MKIDKYYHLYGRKNDVVFEEISKPEERPREKWGKWVISEIRCQECLEYFDTGCYSLDELKTCPNCGALMQVKNELNRVSKELNSEIEKSIGNE